jgi:CRISPR system Cascade subunit CasD
MATLLLRLIGPMQSWGTTSRFDQRDTTKEPSKSGVIGLLAAALGIDRNDWARLEPLARCKFAVRHDRSGTRKRDYQTAQNVIAADGSKRHPTAVTLRDYLSDAAFLAALESDDRSVLEAVYEALSAPMWSLSLGRKSYVPSEPIRIEGGLVDWPLRQCLERWPWLSSLRAYETKPETLLISFESTDGCGVLRMDQPLSSFSERRFGARYVVSEWIPFPAETTDVPAPN